MSLSRWSWKQIVVVGCLVVVPELSFGQPTVSELVDRATKTDAAEPPVDQGPSDDFDRGTPRGTIEGFIRAVRDRDYKRAAEYLDLSRVKDAEAVAEQLARHLWLVLDQTLWIDFDTVSPKPEGRGEDGLPGSRDRVGKIETPDGQVVDVLLQRLNRGDGIRIWKISSTTVRSIPMLYEHFGYGPLGEVLPSVFFELELLGVQLWQGVALLVLVLVSYGVGWVFRFILVGTLALVGGRYGKRFGKFLGGPLHMAVAASLFSASTSFLRLSLATRGFLGGLESALLIVAFTWVLFRTVDLIVRNSTERMRRRQKTDALPLLPPAGRSVKLVLVLAAMVAIVDSFGFNVTAVVAGLGVGGIAIALAAQKSVENLFGGISLYADQPVRVGEVCRFGDQIGTIEEIGLRSTRIRTRERTLLTVPNAEFAHLQLDNFTRRDKYWYNPTLGLRYETSPDQMRYVLVEVRKTLYAHPLIDPDPARIRFTSFGAYSLDLEVFAYVNVATYDDFLEVAEDLNLRIMEIVQRAGSSFAFPSQTTYVEKGEGLDREAGVAAERQVREWRDDEDLAIPRFAPAEIHRLRGTLDYPPEGSVMARKNLEQHKQGKEF